MAENDINIRIRSTDETKQGVQQAKSGLDNLKSSATAVSASFLAIMSAVKSTIAVMKEVSRYVDEAIRDFETEQRSLMALDSSLKMYSDTVELTGARIRALANEYQALGLAENEEILIAGNLLAQMKMSDSQIDQSIRAIINLKSGMEQYSGTTVSVNQATVVYRQLLEGQDRALRSNGLALDENIIKTKDMTAIIAEINKQYQASTDIIQGQYTTAMKAIESGMGDVKKAVGDASLALRDMAGVDDRAVVDALRGITTEVNTLATALRSLAADPEVKKALSIIRDAVINTIPGGNLLRGGFEYLKTKGQSQLALDAYDVFGKAYDSATMKYGAGGKELNDIVNLKAALPNLLKEAYKTGGFDAMMQTLKDNTAKLSAYVDTVNDIETETGDTGSMKISEMETQTFTPGGMEQQDFGDAKMGGALESYKASIAEVRTAWSEVKDVLAEIDDLVVNNVSQNLAGLLTGEDVDFGEGLKQILKSLLADLIRIGLQTLFIRVLMGLFTGGAGAAAGGAAGPLGSVAGGIAGPLGAIGNVPMPQGMGAIGNTYIVNVKDPFPVVSDYEKGKYATQIVSTLQKLDARGTH